MRRQPFYQIDPGAYLHQGAGVGAAEQHGPEEAVRQWCAFELIRAYGFRVTNLQFEHPVKVGSRTYRIDIVVLRNNSPWIVVECKEPDYSRHAHAIEQAISYADAKTIQAEFAVYTNGSTWHVRRKVQSEWVTIPDLAVDHHSESIVYLSQILSTFHELSPLLLWLDESVKGEEAKMYLDAMQSFFHAHNLLLRGADQELVHGTDYLLRVLSVKDAHVQYQLSNLQAARRCWDSYRERIGSDVRISEVDEGDRLRVAWYRLHNPLMQLISGEPKPPAANTLLLRLNLALLDYGQAATEAGDQFIPLSPAIHHALRDFLNFALTVHFNTRLPDSIDDGAMRDMKQYCRSNR